MEIITKKDLLIYKIKNFHEFRVTALFPSFLESRWSLPDMKYFICKFIDSLNTGHFNAGDIKTLSLIFLFFSI